MGNREGKGGRALARNDDELKTALARVDFSDPSQADIRAVGEALREVPGMWRKVCDLAKDAADSMIDAIGASRIMKELIRSAHEGLRCDLGHAEASALEKVLIDQVALTWLRLSLLEQGYTNRTMGEDVTFSVEEGNYWECRLSAAQRRYLRACETLARVRKMGLPALQVNIAGQQVNIGHVT